MDDSFLLTIVAHPAVSSMLIVLILKPERRQTEGDDGYRWRKFQPVHMIWLYL